MLPALRLALLSTALVAPSAFAQVSVVDPWVRGTTPQQKATGAFMKLEAKEPVALVAVSSPAAGVTEIHEMTMEKDVMKMRPIPRLAVAPGKPAELKPGGYHVMLMDLKQPLKAGDSVPITLTFEKADKSRQTVEVKATVRALGAPTPAAAHGDHKMKH
ncbi:MAG: copper chaperone PCu(A)C [Burkholderiales bacterium]